MWNDGGHCSLGHDRGHCSWATRRRWPWQIAGPLDLWCCFARLTQPSGLGYANRRGLAPKTANKAALFVVVCPLAGDTEHSRVVAGDTPCCSFALLRFPCSLLVSRFLILA